MRFFKHIRKILISTYVGYPVVRGNLKMAKTWTRIAKILSREEVDTRVLGMFYRALSQLVLLFRLYTYLLTGFMLFALEGLHT